MLRSLYSGVSGISVNQSAMDVIGNNIANVNTTGYKESRAVFADLMSVSLTAAKSSTDALGGIDPMQIGSGAYLSSVDTIFAQGVITATSSTTDLAISGEGFFVVGDGAGNQYYTRSGAFSFDVTGAYTSASGYIVQGWMSDPVTGEMNQSASVSDIVLGTSYTVMQAKASTEINLAGNLCTTADASILEYQQFLTQAGERTDFSDMYNENGLSMDLADGESVKISAHATSVTGFGSLYNSNDTALNITIGDSITFTFEADTATVPSSIVLQYSSSDSASQGYFNTVEGFIDAFNFASGYVQADGSIDSSKPRMSIVEGELTITAGDGSGSGSGFDLKSISGNSVLASILEPLTGAYNTNYSNTSYELYTITEITHGTDFDNLTELASEIENALNSSVLGTAGISVDYLDNNFGLEPGETVEFETTAGTFTFTYSEDIDNIDASANEFNTVAQLASLLESEINNALGDIVRIGTNGNEMVFTYIGGDTDPTINITDITLGAASGANSPEPNSYLEQILESSFITSAGVPIDINSATPTLYVEEIAGKGRLIYSNNTETDTALGTVAIDLSGFSIEKATNGEVFNSAIISSSVISSGDMSASSLFLASADEDTYMMDLFSMQGESFDFTEGVSSITFNASIGGDSVTDNNLFSINISSTVGDLMDSMEDYLGLGSGYNTFDNVTMEDGVITVRGENGYANLIDYFSLNNTLANDTTFSNSMVATIAQDASGGYLATNVEIYDEQGNRHVVNVEFSLYNLESNEWKVSLSTDDPLNSVFIDGATSNEMIIKFNSDGSMGYIYDTYTNPITVLANPTLSLSTSNGANTVTGIEFNIGSPSQYDGMTLSASANGLTLNSTDGYTQGTLEQALFNSAGELIGSYSNGEIRTIAQVALATFTNDQGLLKVGDSMYAATSNSGDATIGTPQTGERGDISASSLENSNVDLTTELVNMITTQRGFEASSSVITTADEMIQELLSMKR